MFRGSAILCRGSADVGDCLKGSKRLRNTALAYKVRDVGLCMYVSVKRKFKQID